MLQQAIDFVLNNPIGVLATVTTVLGSLNVLPKKWSRNVTEAVSIIIGSIKKYRQKKNQMQKRLDKMEEAINKLKQQRDAN
jgi:hypothetical protein